MLALPKKRFQSEVMFSDLSESEECRTKQLIHFCVAFVVKWILEIGDNKQIRICEFA